MHKIKQFKYPSIANPATNPAGGPAGEPRLSIPELKLPQKLPASVRATQTSLHKMKLMQISKIFQNTNARWRSEVQIILSAGIYQEPMIMTNVRRSLRGRAADVLLTMGTEVRVQQVLDRFDVRFGDVCPTDMTLEQFFTARQLPTESMSAWGCRLEEIVSKIKYPGSAEAAHSMLRSRYWTGIYSDKICNALRHNFDDGADFESLLRQARIAEQEPTSMPVQQRAVVPNTEELDEILRQLKELTCWVTELEKRCLYPSSSPVPSHPSQVVNSAAVPPVVTGPSAETKC